MTTRRLIPIIAVIVVVAAAVLAFVLSSDATPDPGGSSSAPPASSSTAPSGSASESPPSGATTIDGAALPTFENPTDDPAVGLPIPTVSATGMDGQTVTIGPGKPTIVLFLAHWCPHCQREVPLVQSWVDAGGLGPDVDLVAVSTSIDPAAPNYPPADWLASEGWTAPTIEDLDRSIATAYGLPAFPYWVFTSADGSVVLRLTGELTTEQLDTVVAMMTEG